jgi:hypothetical protein
MQQFIDTKTKIIYAFDDDVIVVNKNGIYSFKTPDGIQIISNPPLPITLRPQIPV